VKLQTCIQVPVSTADMSGGNFFFIGGEKNRWRGKNAGEK
jgi:hypothetical protein